MASGLTLALIDRRTIKASGGEFSVRGLSPQDVFCIYRRHAGDMALWFDKLQGTADLSLDAAPALAASLLDTAPGLCAEIIAAGADAGTDEEAIGIAKMLSLGVQAEALKAIADLTFTEEMPPKKLLEIVTQMARSVNSPTPST